MNARLTGVLIGVGALGLLVAPGAAFAEEAGTIPSCNDTTMFPNPIYITGSSAFEPVIQAMANQLRTRTVGDGGGNGAVTLIYQTGGNSCGGVAAVRDQSNLTGSAHYETCGFGTGPTTVADYSGPARAMPAVTIADPNTAIGFLAADAFDTQQAKMRALAFRGLEQTQAYYADSAADTFDKRNVRDGHYLAWGYDHLIVKLDATTGKPSAAAQNFVDWVMNNPTAAESAPNFDPILLQATAHVIPNNNPSLAQLRWSAGGAAPSVLSPIAKWCYR